MAFKKKHWIFKICASIPNNYHLIMGYRNMNFEDLMFFLKRPYYSFYLIPLFLRHPVYSTKNCLYERANRRIYSDKLELSCAKLCSDSGWLVSFDMLPISLYTT